MCIETRLHVVPLRRVERTKTGASSRKLREALHEEVTCACHRETGAIDLGALQRHQACHHRWLGVPPFQGRSFHNLDLVRPGHTIMLHSAARFCRFAKTPRTPPHRKSDTLTGPSRSSGAETFVAHFSLGPSKTFATLLMSKWSSSNTQSSLRQWAPTND